MIKDFSNFTGYRTIQAKGYIIQDTGYKNRVQDTDIGCKIQGIR